MLATIRIETLQGVPVARLVGEVDASNAQDVGARLTEAVPNTAMGVVLDLSETTYLDSSGVQLLFLLADRLRRRQQRLHVVVPPESFVGDVLQAVNLGGSAVVESTVVEALDRLRAA
ncbi:MAG: STAS domain-containing protein [Thermoleophilaceae bacterium]